MVFLAPLFALFLPAFIWPIELILPYPYLVEEIAKGLLIFWIISSDETTTLKLKIVVAVGVLFSFSELVLYLFNIYLVGDLSTIFVRLALTTFLHVVTSLIIFIPGIKDRRLMVLGLILAVVIHYLFNYYIGRAVLL
jgi:hypothetical protein